MSIAQTIDFPTSLRRRAIGCKKLARTTHSREISETLEDLARYLELEAIIEESQIDPFRRHRGPTSNASKPA